jgi:hypothetical protein
VAPLWSGAGKSIFFLTQEGKLMEAEVKSGQPFQTGIPKLLFQTNLRPVYTSKPYAVAADGKRFFVAEPTTVAPGDINVMVNWNAMLRR